MNEGMNGGMYTDSFLHLLLYSAEAIAPNVGATVGKVVIL